MDFIDIMRNNSERLLIILYSNQFCNNTVETLVFYTIMFDYSKILSVLLITTMQNLNCLILTRAIKVVDLDVLVQLLTFRHVLAQP